MVVIVIKRLKKLKFGIIKLKNVIYIEPMLNFYG
jgi:hypothetical protein